MAGGACSLAPPARWATEWERRGRRMKKPPEGSICDVALKACYVALEYDAAINAVNGPVPEEECEELYNRLMDLVTIAVARAESDPERN